MNPDLVPLALLLVLTEIRCLLVKLPQKQQVIYKFLNKLDSKLKFGRKAVSIQTLMMMGLTIVTMPFRPILMRPLMLTEMVGVIMLMQPQQWRFPF